MTKLHVAKIVATATDSAWSQAYHAGGVTAILSVEHKDQKTTDSLTSLHIVGKDLLNTFESEYFTLPTKNLTSIKKAVELTYKKSSDTHKISFLVAVIIQNALYVTLAGRGRISLFRKGKQAVLLEQPLEEEVGDVLAGSGFLDNGDMVVLETIPFSEIISDSTLTAVLENNTPSDAAEILSPKIHEVEEGGAAGLILGFEEPMVASQTVNVGPTPSTEAPLSQAKTTPIEEKPLPQAAEEPLLSKAPPEPFIAPEEKILPMQESTETIPEEEQAAGATEIMYKSPKKKRLSHRQKLFLTIAIILFIVFVASIFLSLTHKKQNQATSLFSSLYPTAQKKYEEGQSLLGLNKNLAQDDLQQAKNMLEKALPQLPADSQEAKQAKDLLSKINTSLESISQANQANATQVDLSTDPLLAFAKSQSTQYVTQNDKNFYSADSNGITQVNKTSNKSLTLIKNSNAWKEVGGLGTYLSNFYLLDTADGILKYIPSGSSYAKSQYFGTTPPDLSKAVSLAIDGSMWVLESDGSILKYTKGQKDTLTLSGLDKPFSSPSQIITTADFTNVYILDKGNGRIVELSKSGAFTNQYANSIISQALMMDISEKDKKAYVLSGGNLYEIDLK